MRRLLLLPLLMLLALPVQAAESSRAVLVLLTGDNGGEVAQCGCRVNPSGGLPRRKTVIDQARSGQQPTVLLDSGNALFKSASDSGDTARARAELILQSMGELGYAGLAVGPRDLAQGVDFLRAKAKAANVPLLSANLLGPDGKRLFEASRVLTAGDVKLGIVGVSPAGTFPGAKDLKGGDPVKAALEETERLRKSVDVVIVLAAIPFDQAQALHQQAAGGIDFIVQSYEGRGAGMAQRLGSTFLFGPGERGRSVAKLTLDVNQSGPWSDRADAERLRERIRLLEKNEAELQRRISATQDAAARKSLQGMVENFQAQKKALADAGGTVPQNARLFTLEHVNLGENVASDPRLEKLIHPYK